MASEVCSGTPSLHEQDQTGDNVTFKIGDRVRIASLFTTGTDDIRFDARMSALLGKEGVVLGCTFGNSLTACTVAIDGDIHHSWCWPAECLNLLVNPVDVAIAEEARAIMRDAERYRHLRMKSSHGSWDLLVKRKDWGIGTDGPVLTLDNLDKAVDESMVRWK